MYVAINACAYILTEELCNDVFLESVLHGLNRYLKACMFKNVSHIKFWLSSQALLVKTKVLEICTLLFTSI